MGFFYDLSNSFGPNNYTKYRVASLYACMASTFLLNKSFCKFKQSERLKLCLLSILFIVKIGYCIYCIYYIFNSGALAYHTPSMYVITIHFFLFLFTNTFVAYILGKSALKMHSLSSIWNLDLTIISKPCFFTAILLAIINFIFLLSTFIFTYLLNK